MFTVQQLREITSQISNGLNGNGWLVCKVIFGIYICILAIMDIRTKKLHLGFLISGFLLSAAGWRYHSDTGSVYIAAGFFAGVCCMIISRLTREAFGYGDSILVMITGSFLGIWELLYMMLFASVLASAYSVVMMIRKKLSKKSAIPFVPFLASAYVGGMIFGIY